MDETLSRALKKKKDLLIELKQVEEFIDLYETLFGQKQEQDNPVAGFAVPDSTLPAPTRKKRRGTPNEIADIAEKVIRAAGRPLTRGELVDALEEMGINLQSSDKPRYIGTILWRHSDRFVNVEGRGYWLKGVPYSDGLQTSILDGI